MVERLVRAQLRGLVAPHRVAISTFLVVAQVTFRRLLAVRRISPEAVAAEIT
jgi:hypothetical protein